MKKKEDKYRKETDDWKNKYLRALADYQNLERRVGESGERDRKSAAKGIILKFLPVIDDLIKAQKQINDQGLLLIIAKIDGLLRTENVARVTTVNKQFNPDYMEAIGVVGGEKEDLVVEEARPAYLMNSEVLQTAQVIVTKKENQTP